MSYIVTVLDKDCLEEEEHLFNNYPTILTRTHNNYTTEVDSVISSYKAIYKNIVPPLPVMILTEDSHKVYIYDGDFFSIKEEGFVNS